MQKYLFIAAIIDYRVINAILSVAILLVFPKANDSEFISGRLAISVPVVLRVGFRQSVRLTEVAGSGVVRATAFRYLVVSVEMVLLSFELQLATNVVHSVAIGAVPALTLLASPEAVS